MTDHVNEPPPRKSEVMEIVTTVVATLNEVITALRDEVAALGENERAGRRRISIYLAVLGVVAIASVFGVFQNYRQGDNVKTIVNYISDCQKPESECKKQNDAVIAQAVIGISARAFDSITCVLLTPPDDRTDANVKACRDKYLAGAK